MGKAFRWNIPKKELPVYEDQYGTLWSQPCRAEIKPSLPASGWCTSRTFDHGFDDSRAYYYVACSVNNQYIQVEVFLDAWSTDSLKWVFIGEDEFLRHFDVVEGKYDQQRKTTGE